MHQIASSLTHSIIEKIVDWTFPDRDASALDRLTMGNQAAQLIIGIVVYGLLLVVLVQELKSK